MSKRIPSLLQKQTPHLRKAALSMLESGATHAEAVETVRVLLDMASPFEAIQGPAGLILEVVTDQALWPIVAELVVGAAEHAMAKARAKAGA